MATEAFKPRCQVFSVPGKDALHSSHHLFLASLKNTVDPQLHGVHVVEPTLLRLASLFLGRVILVARSCVGVFLEGLQFTNPYPTPVQHTFPTHSLEV